MEDLKIIFAQNLIALRKQMKLTQIELAEKINYSDKAVSKWERGESIPDVSVLMVIANLFGVSIDFLVTKHENDEIAKEQTSYAAGIKKKNRSLITAITFVAALVLELVVFITLQGANPDNLGWNALYCYVFPLPIIAIVAVVFSSLWWGKYANFAAVSFLICSVVTDAFLITLLVWRPFPLIFLVVIPAEIIAMMSFKIKVLSKVLNTDKKNTKVD